MKVLIVNRFFAPDQSATSRMATSLAAGLASDSFEVEAIASAALHDGSGDRLSAVETIDGVHVTRIGGTRFGRGTLLGRALDYASFHVSAARQLMRSASAGDVCIVCTDPPLMSVTALLPLLVKRAALVNWLNDLFPEVAFQAGIMRPGGWLGRGALSLRDLTLRRAAANVAPIEKMAEALMTRGVPCETLSVVHHWSEDAVLAPMRVDENALRREWGLQGKFVVGYSGNLGRAHDFATLLDAAERLQTNREIVFLIVGGGHRLEWVKSEVARRRLANFVIRPLQPQSRLRECLAAPDVHFVSLRPAFETSVVPSKFYGIAASGRPTLFVGDQNGEIARLVRANACGEAFEIGAGADLANAIERLCVQPEIVSAWGANARALFDARFTRARGLAAWREVILSCVSVRPQSTGSMVAAPSGSSVQ